MSEFCFHYVFPLYINSVSIRFSNSFKKPADYFLRCSNRNARVLQKPAVILASQSLSGLPRAGTLLSKSILVFSKRVLTGLSTAINLELVFRFSVVMSLSCIWLDSCPEQIRGLFSDVFTTIKRGNPDSSQCLADRFRFTSWSLSEGLDERIHIETVE